MTLYCDLDGVLADFETGVLNTTGRYIEELTPPDMWTALAKANSFFEYLEWMPEGQDLWANIIEYSPVILTGIPYGGWAAQQKRDWCANKLGKSVEVIPCWSKDKHLFAIPGDILIDDSISAKDKWVDAGGIFLHYINTKDTLKGLETIFR